MVDVRVYCLKGILTKNSLKIGVFGVFGVMFTDGEGWHIQLWECNDGTLKRVSDRLFGAIIETSFVADGFCGNGAFGTIYTYSGDTVKTVFG